MTLLVKLVLYANNFKQSHNNILEQLAKVFYNVRLKDNGSYSTIRVIKE